MKKILFFGSYPPPYGGISSLLFELMPALINEGYEVVSLSPSQRSGDQTNGRMRNIFFNPKGYFLRRFIALSLKCIMNYRMVRALGLRETAIVMTYTEKTLVTIREERVDALFVFSVEAGYMIPLLRKKLGNGFPIALEIFGSIYERPEFFKKISAYLKSIFSGSNRILSSSQYCASSVKNVLDLDFPTEVIYSGVDTASFHPRNDGSELRRELNIPSDYIVFLFLARMIPDMGLDFLLSVAKRVIRLDPKCCLIVAGATGNLTDAATELSEEEQRITVCPDIPFSRKPEYLAMCDILLAPTKDKRACMGLSIKESMASGKPAIASDSGGIHEAVLDGETGYLIPINNGSLDEDLFMARAELLLKNGELREEMGVAARRVTLDLFSLESMVSSYLNIIRSESFCGKTD
jgi:glycosyltransferase involved in cell wall biosynthesis